MLCVNFTKIYGGTNWASNVIINSHHKRFRTPLTKMVLGDIDEFKLVEAQDGHDLDQAMHYLSVLGELYHIKENYFVKAPKICVQFDYMINKDKSDGQHSDGTFINPHGYEVDPYYAGQLFAKNMQECVGEEDGSESGGEYEGGDVSKAARHFVWQIGGFVAAK